MYEAPDRYKRMISARLPGGERMGFTSGASETGSSPLRDVQLISRGQLAPFFAAANMAAAVLMVACLWGAVPSGWLFPWIGAVAAINFLAMQLARTQAVTHVGRSGRLGPGRRPGLRRRLVVELHRRIEHRLDSRAKQRSVPAHAVDPVHSGRVG